jgi:hypothetical protein
MNVSSRVWTGAVVTAAALLLFNESARAAVDVQSQRVIRQSAATMGIAALRGVQVIRLDATVKAAGLSGTQTQWIGVEDTRFAEFATLPPLEADDGYDGRVAWSRDQSGLVWNEGSDAGRSTEISNAYLAAYALWQPDAAGASVTYRGQKMGSAGAYDVLRVLAPGSKIPMDLWFARRTHVLTRERQAVGPVINTVTLSQYRRVRGVLIPFAYHIDNTNGNNSDAAVTRVAFDPAGGKTHLARPVSTVHDFLMSNGAASTPVPFDLVENHVYLDVMLNGKGPYHMIFDTGGANIVDPAVAREIGAFGTGSVQGSGVGAKTESLSFAKVDTLKVGDAILRDQVFAVAPVRAGFGISAGRSADGLIGWEVLARYVTTFDYAGARDTMTFYAPYLEEHPQVQPTTLTAAGVGGFGVGGPSFGRLGRVQTVSIDDLTLHDLVADYSNAAQGAFANPFTAANLGGNLLRRFNVTFDYAHETMALVPNASFAQPDTYERSGLFVVNLGGKKTVIDARAGTPAAAAGLVKGDVITSVNGTPADSMTLDALRQYFWQPAGTVLTLGVTSKTGSARTVQLTLRDYV